MGETHPVKLEYTLETKEKKRSSQTEAKTKNEISMKNN